ncbi:MAG: OmpA family protein [candidate division WOR-3 bacterium]
MLLILSLLLALEPKGPLGKDTLRGFESFEAELKRGKLDRALERANKWKAKSPESFLSYYNLALVYQAMGEWETAIALYDSAFWRAPDNRAASFVRFNQAFCYESIYQYDKATEGFKEYLALLARMGVTAPDKSEVTARIEEDDNLAVVLKRAPRDINVAPAPGLTEPNSAYAVLSDGKGGDYSPVITVDGSRMYFTSTRKAGKGREDIWTAERGPDGQWVNVKDIWGLNTSESEGVSGVSGDGAEIYVVYYTERFPKEKGVREGMGNMDIFSVKRIPGGWSQPQNLGPAVNSKSWDSQASVSADGTEIYFASTRAGGLGGSDIWVSRRNPDGTWSEAENLGPPVNTPGDELSPFIHCDGKTLYFSSDGHRGFGGYDIFVSKKEFGRWTRPQNLGPPYNTHDNDLFFTIPASGRVIYFARADSSDEKRNPIYHIYQAELPPRTPETEDVLPEPVTLVKARVFDKITGAPVPARVGIEDLKEAKRVFGTQTDSIGEFYTILPSKRLYGITAEALVGNYAFYSANFDLRAMSDYQEYRLDVPLTPLAEGATFVINNIFFEFDKADLLPESKPELDRLLRLMNTYPAMKISVEGHTDSIGTYEYNMKLSSRRAEAVVNYLLAAGISKERIVSQGFGYTRPIASNDTPEGRALNRRVEIRITEFPTR